MGTLRLNTAILALALLSSGAASAQQRTLTWNWANTLCGEMLSCNTGCSACNQPTSVQPDFHGTNAAWIGISTCPHPVATGDNAVLSEGWALGPEPLKTVLIGGIATGPMDLDSIIIRHRAMDQGPAWLRVSLNRDLTQPAVQVYEGPITGEFTALQLADLGSLKIPEGYTAAGFQLQLQAFGGNGGAWALDEVRVVASPAEDDLATGLTELVRNPQRTHEPMFDLLGRTAPRNAGMRIARDGKRTIVVE